MHTAIVPRIIGKYKTQLYDNGRQQWLPSSPGIGMHVEVSSYWYCDSQNRGIHMYKFIKDVVENLFPLEGISTLVQSV